MLALLALHLGLAVVAPAVGARVGRRVFLLVALAPGATAVWAATRAGVRLAGTDVPVRGDGSLTIRFGGTATGVEVDGSTAKVAAPRLDDADLSIFATRGSRARFGLARLSGG